MKTKSTQKPEARAQSSSVIKNMRSKPTLQNDGMRRVSPYSTPHHSDPRPAETGIIDDWIRDLPEVFSDVDGGIMEDLTKLALFYLEQLKLAAMEHRSAVSLLEEHRHKMCLLIDDSNLDPRLAENPRMENLFVSNLLSLILLLNTGINFVTAKNRQSLRKDTNRVVEQTSSIAFDHLQRSAHCLPNNIFEFLEATEIEIKSRIDNFSELMHATHHPAPSFDMRLSPRIEETGPDIPRPYGSDKLPKRARRHSERLRFKRLHSQRPGSSSTSVVGSSSISKSAENSGRAHSDPFKSSSKHSSRSTKSPSILSRFSDDGSHSHIRPSTITATSTSPSEVRRSYSEVVASTSTRPSTNDKNCNTSLDENEEGYESRVLGRQFKEVEVKMPVKIRHRESRRLKEKTMLVDTGCDHNFIIQSLVKELDLDVVRLTTPISLKGFANYVFQVDQAVLPEWRFSEGLKMHQEFTFHIVPHIPGGIGIVLGNKARRDMNIRLCQIDGALVAMEDPEDGPTRKLSKLQRTRQDRDETETGNRRRHEIAAKHAEVVQRKQAAAKPSNRSKSQNSTSQRDPGGSGDS